MKSQIPGVAGGYDLSCKRNYKFCPISAATMCCLALWCQCFRFKELLFFFFPQLAASLALLNICNCWRHDLFSLSLVTPHFLLVIYLVSLMTPFHSLVNSHSIRFILGSHTTLYSHPFQLQLIWQRQYQVYGFNHDLSWVLPALLLADWKSSHGSSIDIST